jgi:hypothetical protein
LCIETHNARARKEVKVAAGLVTGHRENASVKEGMELPETAALSFAGVESVNRDVLFF